ncbi:MAG: VWA domain-containing protein [Bdellovibrionota bacterium]
MEWKNPQAFLLFIPLVLAVLWYFYRRRYKTASLQFSYLEIIRPLPKGWRTHALFLPLALKFLALAFVILALARPQIPNTKIRKNIEGIDIVICLDISDSMLIEDMRPHNRLESAKETIRKFVERRSSDRIGVVVFAGEAFTLVPPTLDYQLLLSRISEIDTAQNARIKDGTAIGVGLANAVGRLKDSGAKSRILIFLTDGENNSGTIDPETAIEMAKGYALKIYSIGIGKDGPTRLPIYQKDFMGNRVKNYVPFESSVNETLLSKMAHETGGKFFRASREDSLSLVFKEIDSLEKTKIDVNRYVKYTESYQKYLFWSLVCYIISWLLGSTFLKRSP